MTAAVIYNNRIKQIRANQPAHEYIMLPRLIYDYNVTCITIIVDILPRPAATGRAGLRMADKTERERERGEKDE